MSIYLIIKINDQGFPDIAEVCEEKPNEDRVDYWRRFGTKISIAQLSINTSPYHRESSFKFPIQ